MMVKAGVRVCMVLAVAAALGCAKTEDAPNSEAAVDAATPAGAPAGTPPAAAPATSRDVCAMISADELKTATRIDGAGTKSKSGSADVCTWYGGGGAAIVQVYPGTASYEQSRSAFEDLYDKKAEDLSGVGERAFYVDAATGSMPTGTLSAVKGNGTISVQIMGGTDAAARKKDVIALANVVLSKL
jgi:hypothetical protein